jgi:hypothetical protein
VLSGRKPSVKASAQHSGAIALTAFCNGETAKTFWRPHESLDAAMTRAAQRIMALRAGCTSIPSGVSATGIRIIGK